MRKLCLLFSIFLIAAYVWGDNIEFSGGESSVELRDGRENVTLSGGASVTVGSMIITADEITLTGENWRYVECSGGTSITDEERGISIKTQSIWYDRENERILISSWFEIDDTENEVYAAGASLEYLLEEELLRLSKDISLLKASDDSIMRCTAESVVFSRTANTVELRGNASVDWNGDRYEAEVISVNLDTESIMLDGRIRGVING